MTCCSIAVPPYHARNQCNFWDELQVQIASNPTPHGAPRPESGFSPNHWPRTKNRRGSTSSVTTNGKRQLNKKRLGCRFRIASPSFDRLPVTRFANLPFLLLSSKYKAKLGKAVPQRYCLQFSEHGGACGQTRIAARFAPGDHASALEMRLGIFLGNHHLKMLSEVRECNQSHLISRTCTQPFCESSRPRL